MVLIVLYFPYCKYVLYNTPMSLIHPHITVNQLKNLLTLVHYRNYST